ncbi:acyltransferase domain-containing protein [Nonomuraea sp. NPDC050556]|uniref:acyltransferase domain-containing protein n=1 Tax=Nonomuraea sp. NPDC050556 TaxID=3364369 RepID=UPI0037BD7C54
MDTTAWMFPGPSGHVAGSLSAFVRPGSARMALLEEVDEVSERHGWGPVSPLLMEDADGAEQHAGHLWLGFFATSLILADVLAERGTSRDVLVGHSGGEVSALVVAGSLTAGDAAHVLCERTKAVDGSGLPPCGMVAIEAPAARVAGLCAAVGDPSLAIAVDNGPAQVVVSGLTDGIGKLEDIASVLEIKTTRLRFEAAYHNPILGGAALRLVQRIEHVPVRAPLARVHSPQLGRDIASADDARELLAGTLVLPVRFRESLRRLYDEGVRTFVECGGKQVLSGLVPECLPSRAVTVPMLTGKVQARMLAAALPGVTTVQAPPVADGLPPEAELRDRVRLAYAEALRFPAEMVEDDTELEADLGVSSLQRTNVFVQLLDLFDLPTPRERIPAGRVRTVADMAGLLRELAAAR